jgi:hypothetical protein
MPQLALRRHSAAGAMDVRACLPCSHYGRTQVCSCLRWHHGGGPGHCGAGMSACWLQWTHESSASASAPAARSRDAVNAGMSALRYVSMHAQGSAHVSVALQRHSSGSPARHTVGAVSTLRYTMDTRGLLMPPPCTQQLGWCYGRTGISLRLHYGHAESAGTRLALSSTQRSDTMDARECLHPALHIWTRAES